VEVAKFWEHKTKGDRMKNLQKSLLNTVAAAVLASLVGCARMSEQGQDTAIGAGAGALGSAVLTNGSGIGTVGGAAVGGRRWLLAIHIRLRGDIINIYPGSVGSFELFI
jgi:osmotically inducible lipoprotein OsmB